MEKEIKPLRCGDPVLTPKGTCVQVPEGGVTSARGFSAAAVHGGFKPNTDRLDFAMLAADEPCAAAGMFTTNVFCAPPVRVSREHLDGVCYGTARAVIINAGNANAATGSIGVERARESCRMAAEELGCCEDEVLVSSTGVIGIHLPLEPFKTALPLAVASLSPENGAQAARAIMTTDTHPKEAAFSFSGDEVGYPGCTFTVGGMAKGSGMIMPNMATMISVLTTDAPIEPFYLHEALVRAVNLSFNKVSVDSDTSTNDSCYLFANGAAAPGAAAFAPGSSAFACFEEALQAVCGNLARQMAEDGEGATRLLTVNVSGAADEADADLAARAVANSPLVKTAVYGHDANWGRIAMAIGKSGARFSQENVAIDIMGMPVCRDGLTVPFSEEEALLRFEEHEIIFDIDLGEGDAATTVWSCDFSHDYVSINGDYRS